MGIAQPIYGSNRRQLCWQTFNIIKEVVLRNTRKHELTEILMDENSSISERDDAAMDLGKFDDALDVLISVGSDVDESQIVLACCGEPIAEIWHRLNIFDDQILESLAPAAREELEGRARRADLSVFDRVMGRTGGEPPREGDELPSG